jgi:hypothetical protein
MSDGGHPTIPRRFSRPRIVLDGSHGVVISHHRAHLCRLPQPSRAFSLCGRLVWDTPTSTVPEDVAVCLTCFRRVTRRAA